MNRLYIVDDNLNFSRELLNYISSSIHNIKSYKILIDGQEIYNEINKMNNDDIVLLDLGLPNIDGVEIINVLSKGERKCPYIIVISGNSELINRVRIEENYIYKIFQKPFPLDDLINTIDIITKASNINSIENMIKNELSLFNFKTYTNGYFYLIECIKLGIMNNEWLIDIKNNLYAEVSKKYKSVNIFKIKWSIEKIIDSLYNNTNINIINDYFYLDINKKLTPKIFITTVIDKLKYDL